MLKMRKKMNAEKMWSFVGIFIIVLVLSMPFYSASALAATLEITKNTGKAGIPGFINAQGDTWTVQATIAGSVYETIDPANVNLKIGQNSAPFTSCSGTANDSANIGGIVCDYISPLTDGVKEGEFPFQVVYNVGGDVTKAISNGDIISADGKGPVISDASISQDTQGVHLDFTVTDKYTGKPTVGLKKIEVVDADSGTSLVSITDFKVGQNTYNYVKDGSFEGKLKVPLQGQGYKRIKIYAEDMLGHRSESPAVLTFLADFVNPEIREGSLNFSRMGKFIGEVITSSDIMVDVIEHNLNMVTGYSEQALLDNTPAICSDDDTVPDLWHCRWEKVDIKPSESVSIKVNAVDQYGNNAEKTISRSFTKDSIAPEVVFFGSEHTYQGISYLRKGDNRLLLSVKEQGAGMRTAGVAVNLEAVGGGKADLPSKDCVQGATTFDCYWDFKYSGSGGEISLGLSTLVDNAGNEGKKEGVLFKVDDTGPTVRKIELAGVADGIEHDYLQSGDTLRLKLTAVESSGLAVLVNLNGIVMDAETKYPAGGYTRELGNGWKQFTDENCKRNAAQEWDCVFETDPIRSGFVSSALLEIRVLDTAGNNAQKGKWEKEPKNVKSGLEGKYRVDILGLAMEDKPDYWEVASVLPVGGASSFIDLDTTKLTFSRLPFKVSLKSSTPNVEALSVDIVDCVPKTSVPKTSGSVSSAGNSTVSTAVTTDTSTPSPLVSRSLLYGGVTGTGQAISKAVTLVMEFQPFDGKKVFSSAQLSDSASQTLDIEYTCHLSIFSKVGKNALKNSEKQDVVVKVPFGFSVLGAEDENLDATIQKAKDEVTTGFWGVMGVLAKIIKWLDYLVQVVHLVMGAINLVKGAQASLEGIQKTGLGTAAATAACFGLSSTEKGIDTGISWIDVPVQILSCRPTSEKLGWYKSWVDGILFIYNIEGLRFKEGQPKSTFAPAHSIKDNFYLSIAGLCVPGIINNLDKLRQIKCRKVYCLQNEVRGGLATVSQCNELESLLTCKYFIGELWYIIPFANFWDTIINGIWNAVKDPIALAHTLTIVGCGIQCSVSTAGASTCSFLYYIWDVIGYIEQIAGFITTIVQDVSGGGLKYCDSVV